MNRRGFLGRLLGAGIAAVAVRTGLAETELKVAHEGHYSWGGATESQIRNYYGNLLRIPHTIWWQTSIQGVQRHMHIDHVTGVRCSMEQWPTAEAYDLEGNRIHGRELDILRNSWNRVLEQDVEIRSTGEILWRA